MFNLVAINLRSVSDKYSKRRLAGSTITTVVSLSLVLFMLGLLGIIILNANQLSNHIKENIGFQIILNDNAKEADIAKLQKTLDVSSYVRSTEFVSKEEAAARLKEDLGEDFIEFLGFNPLLASINVHLKAEYANSDSVSWIQKEITETHLTKEIIYNRNLINNINESVQKISVVILFFCSLLMVVALALINNTIRLSIYSKRFIIKTMQLVGATQGFIRRPFVITGIKHGLYGATIAILLLLALLNFAEKQIPELKDLQDQQMLLYLFGLVVVMGVVISWISTSLAVRKYLRLKSDELYY
ncbi:MAG TPA: permease-like cell division protein FtsX [Bacteroidia bacterium]|jgi:cell division transport system permease protein|nr:permease-like cell division protein FtsX [Bacteroidia bacterium]HRG54041.1 permease-like cell division protein FtsX [Bacteroidia bacterium]